MIDLRKPTDYDVYLTIEAYSITQFNEECNKLSALGYKRVGDIVIGGGGWNYIQQWMKEKHVIDSQAAPKK
jgi:hypothetical protein